MASEIQTIAVIGAGDDGRTVTYAALRAGYRTILEDVSVARLEQAVRWISKADAEAGTRLGLPRSIEEAVRAADLIIEAVADEMEMKIELFTIFDKFAKPHAIFTSTSRLIPIADLAAVTFRPERCIGIRVLSAAGRFDALELVPSPQSSEETIATCREVFGRMKQEITPAPEAECTESR